MESFKDWYMDMYWKFDDLFVVSAKFLAITYHEFVLISLCIIWPAITLVLAYLALSLFRQNRRLRREVNA